MAERLGKASDVPEGGARRFGVAGRGIAVFKINGNLYAVDATCTHRGGPLEEGTLKGTTVTCPWHGATFDVTTGKVLSPPAKADVASHKVFIEGDDLLVEIAQPAKAQRKT